MKYDILALEGTDGMIPGEGIEYSVRKGHITVNRNGKTVIDDSFDTGPQIKYIIDGDEYPLKLHNHQDNPIGIMRDHIPDHTKMVHVDDSKPVLDLHDHEPQDIPNIGKRMDSLMDRFRKRFDSMSDDEDEEKEEYSVGNMLPIGMGVHGGTRPIKSINDYSNDDEYDEFGPDITTAESASQRIQIEQLFPSSLIERLKVTEPLMEYALNDEVTDLYLYEKDIEDSLLTMKTRIPVSLRLKKLTLEIAILKLKSKLLSLNKDKNKLKIIDVAKDIISKEKQKRELMKSSSKEEKKEINNLEKDAEAEAGKQLSNAVNNESVNESAYEHPLIFSKRQKAFLEKCYDIYNNGSGILVTENYESQDKWYRDRLEILKEAKPEKKDDIKSIYKFLDTHKNNLIKLSEIADNKDYETNESNAKSIVTTISSVVSFLSAICNPTAEELGIIKSVATYLDILSLRLVSYVRKSNDDKVLSELSKIKNKLSGIVSSNGANIGEKSLKRFNNIIEDISRLESHYNPKEPVKESTREVPSLLDTYKERYEENLNKIEELSVNESVHRSEIKSRNMENSVLFGKINALLLEAANIEEEIKPIIALLNKKGYTTKYSSPGHINLRKKVDKDKDGVYYKKLYSDARIMFNGKYNFPSAPKYWMWKTVDGCDYLDVIPVDYKEEDGTPEQAFDKWKAAYMSSLKDFVTSLKYAQNAKGDDNGPKDKHKAEDVPDKDTDALEESFHELQSIIDELTDI